MEIKKITIAILMIWNAIEQFDHFKIILCVLLFLYKVYVGYWLFFKKNIVISIHSTNCTTTRRQVKNKYFFREIVINFKKGWMERFK